MGGWVGGSVKIPTDNFSTRCTPCMRSRCVLATPRLQVATAGCCLVWYEEEHPSIDVGLVGAPVHRCACVRRGLMTGLTGALAV